ncbi:phosphomevalonate kinase [Actinomyces sp. MRS3W]|uniref:phosphomevalonate kinase n=1 Tax=Actinomyces sp. MRS3W TaxID=2800796 RepID=UPI0028FD745F|nr:phosphomevalonate kinase [Actinomyces sp. MRS3W]MDU0348061.1 phosphomevalonate kinase [Actinomyces sp. MRS3W]
MIRVSAPGKLYLAGEYAVVEPGHRAVLVAVDRFITVTLSRAHPDRREGRITSTLYATGARAWRRRPGDDVAEADGGGVDYVLSAIRVVERIAAQAGRPLCYFDLEVASRLDDGSGRKLGLGSSAAVTVATVRAVAQWYRLPVDDLTVFRMALLASDAVDPVGSGGDLAASALAGWVAYRSPDRSWLRRRRRSTPLAELVRMPWPGLDVRRLAPPPGLSLQVGWTGTPASTSGLVSAMRARHAGSADYARFLLRSQACVNALVWALRTGDLDAVWRRVAENRRLLCGLGRASGVAIETPRLRRLVRIAHEFGASAKSSGAGGGDCGIALCPAGTDIPALRAAWEAAGIQPLDLSVHHHEETL